MSTLVRKSLAGAAPTAHATTHQPGGSDAMAVDAAAATGSLRTLGTGAAQAAAGTDSRLTDARTPTAHATSHQPGGSDAMAVDAAAATGSLRTIGTGATQAAGGTDARLSDTRNSRRHKVKLARQGIFAETFDRNACANSSASVTTVLYCVAIGLLAGETVAKIGLEVATVGSNLTLAKAALLDKDGNRLAVTADEKANLTAGAHLLDVLVAYPVVTDDMYYMAFLDTHSTTGVALKRALSSAVDSRLTGATYGNIGVVNGQTDIQLSNTIVFTGTPTMLPLWMGVA